MGVAEQDRVYAWNFTQVVNGVFCHGLILIGGETRVGDNDYQVKLRHLKEFLEDGHRVKVSLFFRGRENAHKELGFELMNRVLADVREIGVVEQAPKLLGKNILMVIMPNPKAKQHVPKPAAPDSPA